MVMTRHRGDPDDNAYDDFITLATRSTRKRQSAREEANGYDDRASSVSPANEHGNDSRMKPALRDTQRRSLRTRKHVHMQDGGSSDSDDEGPDYRPIHHLRNKPRRAAAETYVRPMRTRRGHPVLDIEDHSDEDELRQEPMDRPRRSRRSLRQLEMEEQNSPRRRSGRPRRTEETTDDTEDETPVPVEFSSTRSSRRIPTPNKAMEDHDQESRRRSTRQKKLLYGTFNQSLLEKHVMLMGEEDEENVEPLDSDRKRKRSFEVEPAPEDGLDMYSRVKRVRRQVKRDMYGMPLNEEEQQQETASGSDTSVEEEEDEEEDEEQDTSKGRQYYLRQHKPRTNLYEAPPIEPQKRQRGVFRSETPPRTFRPTTYRSPAHKSPHYRSRSRKVTQTSKTSTPRSGSQSKRLTEKKPIEKQQNRRIKRSEDHRKKRAFHGNSSTSSSSSSESEDERRFQRRKAKSMARNRNRCLPMNFAPDDISTGILRDRTKIGTSLADVDPMSVDKAVNFDSVGGLGKHIRSLKEMIVFPLLYPEVFERFKIAPPRGCLFYGPPGTGKTLVARALANECSSNERKVAFFMRKGADCLSKWVGESERQLRLLFDQAYQMRPSIIFFDEIDGLAPVRSSRQDQIHSSIVSTLLALMDGLDNRGEIVVIGATNRLDSIDPALRRPGRFDREFCFPLPSVEARQQILQIHTRQWNPKLCDAFLSELAASCVGYCGADLKALCTEGALQALRRRYPQIYTSEDKLELDVSTIEVSARDFHKAMQTIVPASQRSVSSPGKALDRIIRPLLNNLFQLILKMLDHVFPMAIAKSNTLNEPICAEVAYGNGAQDDWCSDEDDDPYPIYESTGRNGRKKRNGIGDAGGFTGSFLNFMQCATQRPFTYRPRLLLAGEPGQGQSTHLGPAILHQLERVPVHVIDLPSLYGISAHTPEEACSQIFREARRTSPSILYMPHIGEFWDVIHQTLQSTFMSLLYDLDPTVPVFLVATSETKHSELPRQVKMMFSSEEVMTMENPSETERRDYFEDLLLNQVKKPPSTKRQAATRVLEILPKAKPVEPRQLTEAELKKVQKQEEKHMRELRLFLRDILNKLGRDRKFGIFAKPVDTEDVPDYYEIITNPMDLSSMMTKIDLHQYQSVDDFVADVNLICSNALEYNPDRDPAGRAIRHRACALRDTCQALIETELDPEFEKTCNEIKKSRDRRGETSGATVPSFYYTKPSQLPRLGSLLSPSKYPSRFSRRARGMEADDAGPSTLNDEDQTQNNQKKLTEGTGPKIRAIVKRVPIHRKSQNKNKSPWCRPSRKRYRKVIIYVDEFGNEVPPPGGASSDHADNDDAEDKEDEMAEKGKEEDETANEDLLKSVPSSQQVTNSQEASAKQEEANEEKENQPLKEPPHSPKTRSQQSSPSTTPPGLRSSSRCGRSPVSGTVLTRSTSPRSVSPRMKPAVVIETPKRYSQTSPGASLSMDDGASKPVSPRTHLRRSRRSSTTVVSEMETSPTPTPAAEASNSPKEASASVRILPSPPSKSPEGKSAQSALGPSSSGNSMASASPKLNEATQDTYVKQMEGVEKEMEKPASPCMRMTRLRSQVPAAMEALAKKVLETEAPVRVIVDDDALRYLLAKTVSATNNATVEHLERLYCRLSQSIFAHRSNIDKTDLLEELGQIVACHATNHRST